MAAGRVVRLGACAAALATLLAAPAQAFGPYLLAAAPAPDGGSSALESALAAYPDGELLRPLATDVVVDGVNADLLAELLTRAADSRIPAGEILPALQRFHRVAEAALPTDPVVGRYLQGLAKDIPLGRIDAVAGEIESRLGVAARQVDAVCPFLSDPGRRSERLQAIDHAAYALGVGVEPALLDRSLDLLATADSPYEEVRAPILTMSLLVSAGFEGDRSFEVVQAAWTHGLRGGDLERLGESVVRLGQSGQEPHELMAHVLGLLEQELPTETILHDLDALQADPTEGALPPGPAGDHPTRRRVPGDRPDNQSRDNFGGGPPGQMPDQQGGGEP